MSISLCLFRFPRGLPLILFFLSVLIDPMILAKAAPTESRAMQQGISRNYNTLPLSFEQNEGQAESQVRFLSRGEGCFIFFKQDEADFLLSKRSRERDTAYQTRERRKVESQYARTDSLRMRLLSAAAASTVSAENRLPGTVNYFVGNDPAKWYVGVSTFERVKYTGVYPGIDLIYYGARGRLEFDFALAAGANPRAIRFRFDGSRRLKVDREGNLIVIATNGYVSFRKPVIYQSGPDNGKDFVDGSFRISAGKTVHFALGHYDHARPLIIDPILNYSTYLGPGSEAKAIAVDAAGEAYVAGWTDEAFPTTSGTFQTNPVDGRASPYIAKFNSSGTALLYSTYLSGGGSGDIASAITVDAAGNAYIAGATNSTDFPITPGAFQATNKSAGKASGFVAVLNSTGTALLYSTYLGGSTESGVTGVGVDTSGNAYVTGFTLDADFPTTTGAYQPAPFKKQIANASSGFVSKLNSTGTALLYSTYLGGTSQDSPNGIAVNMAGDAYIAGDTQSFDFPTSPGALQLTNNAKFGTGFVTKMNASGTGLLYSTYLGGSLADGASAIAVDASDNAYVTGNTASVDFPATSGVFQPSLKTYDGFSATNSFITKFNSSGSGLVYSTFLGGSYNGLGGVSEDLGTGIAVDAQGNAVVAGNTSGLNFPVTTGAFQSQNLSQLNSLDPASFITKINSTASAILYSTYLSGTGDQSGYTCDCAEGLSLDPSGNAYLAGETFSVDFPTTLGALETPFQTTESQSFVTEFNASEMKTLPASTVIVTSNASSVEYGQPVTFTATVQQVSGTTPTGTVGFNFPQLEISDEAGNGFGMGPWTTVGLNGSGAAMFTTSSLIPGYGTVNAHYLGDTNNAPSNGTMTQTVTRIPTATTLTSSANPAVYGTPVTFTATVLDNTGKPAKGDVSFGMGDLGYAQVNLDSAGQATWVNGTGGPPLPVGADSVEAEFVPSTGYQQTSNTLVETFTPLGTTPSPTFAPAAGTYTSVQQVVLTDTNSAASIYYTTNGSTPVAGSADVYLSGPIQVNASETIQAMAVAPGYTASSVSSAAYTINLPPSDFSVTLTPESLTVSAGKSTSTTVGVSGLNGFNQVVSLSCSGLPAGVTCSFAPASITSSSISTLTISASSSASANTRPMQFPFVPAAALALATGWIRERRRLRWMVLFACISTLIVLNGCGGGGTASPQNSVSTPATSTILVTGSSGTLSHSAQLTLTVN